MLLPPGKLVVVIDAHSDAYIDTSGHILVYSFDYIRAALTG